MGEDDEQAANLGRVVLGDPHPEAGQVLVD